jgi:hypothetical protein
MPAGLQCFDASGNLIVDITSRLSKICGVATLPNPATNGAFTDPNLSNGTPWLSFQPTAIWGFINMDVSRPIFTISGNTISWTYSPGATGNNFKIVGTLFYGVY